MVAQIIRQEYQTPKTWNSYDTVIERLCSSLHYDKILCTFTHLFFWLGLEKALIMSHCLRCSSKIQWTFWFPANMFCKKVNICGI